jgi:hypothetical protein
LINDDGNDDDDDYNYDDEDSNNVMLSTPGPGPSLKNHAWGKKAKPFVQMSRQFVLRIYNVSAVWSSKTWFLREEPRRYWECSIIIR